MEMTASREVFVLAYFNNFNTFGAIRFRLKMKDVDLHT